VFRHIPKLITDEHNHMLEKSIEMTEAEVAIKKMVKDKASGPDGFTMIFFHACWDWLKEEIWALVEDSQRTWKIVRALNSTFLMLIPKENGTEDPRKLRPIALCNVIYKIISKLVMANRLHPLLPPYHLPGAGRVCGKKVDPGWHYILVHK